MNTNITTLRTVNYLNVRKMMLTCKDMLVKLGYPELLDNDYVLEINPRLFKALGRCSKIGNKRYCIDINKRHFEMDSEHECMDTMMHELIHSISGCMNHGPKFQAIARRVNFNYPEFTIGTHSTETSYVKNVYRKEKRKEVKKYMVKCTTCGHTWKYARKTNLIKTLDKNPSTDRFSCPYCQHTHFSYENI